MSCRSWYGDQAFMDYEEKIMKKEVKEVKEVKEYIKWCQKQWDETNYVEALIHANGEKGDWSEDSGTGLDVNYGEYSHL